MCFVWGILHGNYCFNQDKADTSLRPSACSKDGTAKLWLCATGEPLATLSPNCGPILCMALGDEEPSGEKKEPDGEQCNEYFGF